MDKETREAVTRLVEIGETILEWSEHCNAQQWLSGLDGLDEEELRNALRDVRGCSMLISQSALEAELLSLKDQCECIYRVYPRKVGKKAALEAIKVALRSKPYDELMEAVKAYAESPAGKRGKFTPHPATWFRQGRYDDDRSEWQRAEDEPGSSTTFTELPEDL
jgi:hypothetical protein